MAVISHVGRDDDDVVAQAAEGQCEIVDVFGDAAEMWVVELRNERDAHQASGMVEPAGGASSTPATGQSFGPI